MPGLKIFEYNFYLIEREHKYTISKNGNYCTISTYLEASSLTNGNHYQGWDDGVYPKRTSPVQRGHEGAETAHVVLPGYGSPVRLNGNAPRD